MKKNKLFKNLPFNIEKLYEIQKFIYNSQEFFINIEKWIKILKDYENNEDEFDNSYYTDLLIDFRFDIEINYDKLKNNCNLLGDIKK